MDTMTLTNELQSLDADNFSWKFAVYSTHKSKDGMELRWNTCGMKGIENQINKLKDFLLRKPVADKTVAPYTPFLSDKENIGAIEKDDALIHEQLYDMIQNLQRAEVHAPEDFVTGVLPKNAGFALVGESKVVEHGDSPERIILMRRGNPFLSASTAPLFTTAGEDLVICNKPILKMPIAVDFLLIGGVCYILSSSIEKDFSLENRHFVIAGRQMKKLAEHEIVSDYDQLEQVVMTTKNTRKFLDFDKGILEHIVRLPISEREEFLSIYGVTIDHNGHMDTSNSEQCELIIDLLCCRSCLDPLGRLSVGSNIMRRE